MRHVWLGCNVLFPHSCDDASETACRADVHVEPSRRVSAPVSRSESAKKRLENVKDALRSQTAEAGGGGAEKHPEGDDAADTVESEEARSGAEGGEGRDGGEGPGRGNRMSFTTGKRKRSGDDGEHSHPKRRKKTAKKVKNTSLLSFDAEDDA